MKIKIEDKDNIFGVICQNCKNSLFSFEGFPIVFENEDEIIYDSWIKYGCKGMIKDFKREGDWSIIEIRPIIEEV